VGCLDAAWRPFFPALRRALIVLGGLSAVAATAVGFVLTASSSTALPAGLSWGPAATLSTCGGATTPRVVFPESAPAARTGPGAIVWLGTDCAGGPVTLNAAVLKADSPQPSAALSETPLVRFAALAGTTNGQLVAVAGVAGRPVLGEGRATQGFATFKPLIGSDSLVATQTGFIGDVDVATVAHTPTGYAIEIRAQRHYQHHFGRAIAIRAGPAAPSALAIGMDYRADRLIVWDERGELYARYITNEGHVKARQTLGPAGYAPQLATVVSDDDRAFVIWTDEPAPGAPGTAAVLLAHSTIGPHFRGYMTLTSFPEPATLRLATGAVAAERLSSEGVALLWPNMTASGNLVLDAAAALSNGTVRPPNVISFAGDDVRLGAVAAGPHNEFVALVEVASRTAATDQAIYAIRSNVVHDPGGLGFGALTELAPSGPNSAPAVAIDPATDNAIAAWQAGPASIDWALGS
jgi:hypothetical protein